MLQNRSWNEAYCTAHPGVEYAVFFPVGGNVLLDVSAASTESLSVRWLDIRKRTWAGPARSVQTEGEAWLRLVTPTEEGYWAALVQVSH